MLFLKPVVLYNCGLHFQVSDRPARSGRRQWARHPGSSMRLGGLRGQCSDSAQSGSQAHASKQLRCLFDVILTHLAQVIWRPGLQVPCPRTSKSYGDEGYAQEEGNEGGEEG